MLLPRQLNIYLLKFLPYGGDGKIDFMYSVLHVRPNVIQYQIKSNDDVLKM